MTDDKIDLFSQLRRLMPASATHTTTGKGSPSEDRFPIETVSHWYMTRHYLLHVLPPLDGEGIGPGSPSRVHVVVRGMTDFMLCLVRQVALLAHYPNFDDESGHGRTLITILYEESTVTSPIELLSREEYLCHLPSVCACTLKHADGNQMVVVESLHEDSFVDIELELVGFSREADMDAYAASVGDGVVLLSEERFAADMVGVKSEDISTIDIRDARRVNMVYNVGADIDNLPPDDPNTADRYSRALHYFCYQQSPRDTQACWETFFRNGHLNDQVAARNIISNVCCADCFPSRLRSVLTPSNFRKLNRQGPMWQWKALWSDRYAELLQWEGRAYDDAALHWWLVHEYRSALQVVKQNLQALSKCEHARWVTERLILGYTPLSPEEQWQDEQFFGAAKRAYRKRLKAEPHHLRHIDLCSYRDLQRTNPEDMKYDCFLMMAMVWIMRERK